MKTRKTITSRLGHFTRTGLLAAVAVTAILGGSTVAPALADEWRHRGGDVRAHEWRDHDRFEHRRHFYAEVSIFRGSQHASTTLFPQPSQSHSCGMIHLRDSP
jgi:hypothetical protein